MCVKRTEIHPNFCLAEDASGQVIFLFGVLLILTNGEH